MLLVTRLRALSIGFCILVTLGLPRVSQACDAPPDLTRSKPAYAYENADVVVRATVASYSEPFGLIRVYRGLPVPLRRVFGARWSPTVSATLRVEESWKGRPGGSLTIHSHDTSCGPGFRGLEPGQELLVYAHEEAGRVWVGSPRYIVPIEDSWAEQARAELGPGHRLPVWMQGGWIAMLAVALGLVFGWIVRRRAGRSKVSASSPRVA